MKREHGEGVDVAVHCKIEEEMLSLEEFYRLEVNILIPTLFVTCLYFALADE